MSRPRSTAMLIFVLALVGVTTFAVARVRSPDLRSIPYRGVIARDGVGITGPVTVRFGLFGSAGVDTGCVVSNDCPLWSEEQVVSVVDGTFSVLLGEGGGRPLTRAVVDSPALFVAVAVKAADDAAFTLLSGVDEVVAAPLVQPGAAAPATFATNLFFSAKLSFSGGLYFPSEVYPAGWIPGNGSQQGQSAQLFPRQTFGVTGYTCTATSIGGARLFPILQASVGQIDVLTLGTNGATSPGSFTLMCHGF